MMTVMESKPALVVSNQTTNLLSFRGEVSQENSIRNLEVNEDFIRVVKTTGGDVKPMSILSLMSKGDGTDVYNLYLSRDDHHWSSNIRVYVDGESRFQLQKLVMETCLLLFIPIDQKDKCLLLLEKTQSPRLNFTMDS